LLKFSTSVKQLVHSTYPSLPEDHIRRVAGKAIAYWVEDAVIRMQLLLGGEKKVKEAGP
jgi:hypothetical protein